MVIGTALLCGNVPTMLLAITLVFLFGCSFTLFAVRRAGLDLTTAIKVALAADIVSIAVMELVDNAIIAITPGAVAPEIPQPLTAVDIGAARGRIPGSQSGGGRRIAVRHDSCNGQAEQQPGPGRSRRRGQSGEDPRTDHGSQADHHGVTHPEPALQLVRNTVRCRRLTHTHNSSAMHPLRSPVLEDDGNLGWASGTIITGAPGISARLVSGPQQHS